MIHAKSFVIGVFLTAAIACAVFGSGRVIAGSLTPPGAPAPTMATNQQIYDAITKGAGPNREEGFASAFQGSLSAGVTNIVTVPAGKKLIILKAVCGNASYYFEIDGRPVFNFATTWCDIPDGCVVALPGQTLQMHNTSPMATSAWWGVIGYYTTSV